MRTIQTIIISLVTLFSLNSLAATITDPAAFEWTFHPVSASNPEPYYAGTMEIAEATFNIGGDTITTRAYGQEGKSPTLPGPTMIMKPGFKYVLSFKNKLPFEEKSTAHNVFKDPNISNLHTHGLHISGMSPGDDVHRSFEGGFGGDFVYDIPADHMGGTFWYHAHHHGSTFLQVSGGAFGMLIIDDSQDQIPEHVAAMEEKHFVLGFLDPAAAGTGGDTLIKGTLKPTWTVNGGVGGTTSMPANTWQHWRVLLANRDAKEKTVSIGDSCEVALLARDGVWRTQAPKTLSSNGLSLTGASRADLAVRCSANSSIMIEGSSVANIEVTAQGDNTVHPFASDGVSTWSAKRPSYLRDIRSAIVNNTETVKLGARTINGSKFDHHVPNFVLSADGVEEWQIQGGAMHPFHLHIYHVQVIGNCGSYEDGEYYDVVSGNCKIRFDLNPATSSVFEGTTIMHCHILQHEDQGAMGWANVIGGTGAPTFPVDSTKTFGEYYAFDGGSTGGSIPTPPSTLVANADSSSQISLTWMDNSTDESSFEIERSADGVQFAPAAATQANQTSFTDNNLQPATTYSYRILAKNATGSSAYSNISSATTADAVAGTQVTVESIVVTSVSAGKGRKFAQATVTVKDDQGVFVADAIVTGQFTGSYNESITAEQTGSNGIATLTTVNSVKRIQEVQFCVTSITHPTLQNLTAQPGAYCANY
jgi:suppressor of ftsI